MKSGRNTSAHARHRVTYPLSLARLLSSSPACSSRLYQSGCLRCRPVSAILFVPFFLFVLLSPPSPSQLSPSFSFTVAYGLLAATSPSPVPSPYLFHLCFKKLTWSQLIRNNYHKDNNHIPWKHSFQQGIGLLFLFHKLSSSFNNKFFQVISILLHHINHVVKNICSPSKTKIKPY